MWLGIAWKGRVWNVKSFECLIKEFGFTLGIMEDYQRLINGQEIIMKCRVYFMISFKGSMKITEITAENLKLQIGKISNKNYR